MEDNEVGSSEVFYDYKGSQKVEEVPVVLQGPQVH
jgi:hypothetical protein